MFALAPVAQAVEEMVVTPGPMIFPPFVFGVAMLVLLIVVMGITFSFRNMAASHPKRSRITVYEPVGHPGHPIIEPAEEDAK
ncbi:hypothetical protein [Gulosibacter sp. 10]|uniref:hypothetical protein n=1 Tax=Gulosibacter sp. 10 TaxID=1255570 RepID=UPI001122FD7D|nr:hypothetical protein [Gulosibacter sp. 10]